MLASSTASTAASVPVMTQPMTLTSSTGDSSTVSGMYHMYVPPIHLIYIDIPLHTHMYTMLNKIIQTSILSLVQGFLSPPQFSESNVKSAAYVDRVWRMWCIC